MTHDIERVDERHGMSPGTALLLGIGIGILGTVIAIATNEERFGRAVRTTRKKAKEVGKKVKNKYEETLNNTRHKAADVAEKVEVGARRISEKLND